MILVARTVGAQAVGTNVDRVLGAMPIPIGGSLLSVEGEIHMISANEDQPIVGFNAWGFAGELVPIVAADVADLYNDIWNNVVVKAADLTTSAGTNRLDFDWDTSAGAPTVEPGEIDIDDMLGMSQGQKTFIEPRIEWVSWAKNKQGGFVGGTPDDYQPSDYKTFRSRKKLTADVPSAAMLTISNPLLDDVRADAAFLSPTGEGQWYMMQNMEDTMREVGKFQAGLSEVGAESPGADASALLQELVAPPMLTDSGLFLDIAWTALVVATWVVDYPGDSIPNTIDGR